MLAFYKDAHHCDVPDHLIVGDTILCDDVAYEIYSKTYNVDNNELYCLMKLYDNIQTSVHSLLTKIYDSNHFETSGFNTNEVNSNPRLMILMAVLAVVLGNDHMKVNGMTYKSNVMACWNKKSIGWDEIVPENQPIAVRDINKICIGVTALLKMQKIAVNLWPDFIRNSNN